MTTHASTSELWKLSGESSQASDALRGTTRRKLGTLVSSFAEHMHGWASSVAGASKASQSHSGRDACGGTCDMAKAIERGHYTILSRQLRGFCASRAAFSALHVKTGRERLMKCGEWPATNDHLVTRL